MCGQLGVEPLNLPQATRANLAASTQAAIVEVLVKKSLTALQSTGLKRLVWLEGRRQPRTARAAKCPVRQTRRAGAFPEVHLCTDNGAMIAMAAAMRLQSGAQLPSTQYAFDVKPRWPLDASCSPAIARCKVAENANFLGAGLLRVDMQGEGSRVSL